MRIYARIEDGIVQEIIEPLLNADGQPYGIADRFTPDVVATMVDITQLSPRPACGWTYDGKRFAPPLAALPTE